MRKNAFSLLEMMLAMALFAMVGCALYGMFNVFLSLQSLSSRKLDIRLEANRILDRVELQISYAVTDSFFVFEKGEEIRTQTASCTKKKEIFPVFLCFIPSKHDPLFLSGAYPNTQHLYFTKQERSLASGIENVEKMIRNGNNRVLWESTFLKEQALVLTRTNQIKLYLKNEKIEDGKKNQVDGNPDRSFIGGFSRQILGYDVSDIKYLFWDGKSESWDNEGNPVTEWDSREKGGLPEAIKVILEMKYPEEESSFQTVEKYQRFIFERVIFFKH